MANEVQINVVLNDATAAQRDAFKASYEEWAAGLPEVDVRASNPIDDAWKAQVDTEIQAAGEELSIPVTADTEGLAAEVEAAVEQAQAGAQVDVPVQVADPNGFQTSVEDVVAAAQAGVGAGIEVPVTAAGSFRPTYSPAPLFGGDQDPYAGARTQIQNGTPVELPVRAQNPIDAAWLAQVKSSVKSIAGDALDIPVNADLEPFQATLETTLAELAATTRADIPVDVGDAMIFRAQVAELVQQVESSVHAVIDVQVNNEGALTDLQAKTVAASQASLDLVNAEQKLNQAMASGDEDKIAKARAGVVTATKEESAASKELQIAMATAAEGETVAATAADGASFSMRGLMQAMGPLWMVMNVAQIAMFAFGSTSSSAAKQVSDASQQVIGLGQSAGNAAAGLVAGNTDLQKIASGLVALGSSTSEFAQTYTGSLSDATAYTNRFVDEQKNLSNTPIHWDDSSIQAMEKAIGETNTTTVTADHNVKQLTDTVNSNKDAYNALSPAMKAQVDQLNHLNDVVPQATDALKNMQGAAEQTGQALEGLFSAPGSFDAEAAGAHAFGLSLNDVEQAYDNIKLANPKDTLAQVSAAFDSNMSSAMQAANAITASMQQEQQAVTSAQQAVNNANHSAEQSTLAVANAHHAEQQATQAYTNALDQQKTAQQAVIAAQAQAEQQLIDLRLQQADAAEAALNANVQLFDAQEAAAKLGVNSGNVQSFADLAANGEVTAANEAQVKAALALIAAQNQVADSQNTSTQATKSLNTAQQQGIDNNPNVIAANKALVQAQQQVEQAAYAEKQAHDQVGQALYAEQQASDALRNAKQQLTTAENNQRDATNLSTQSGQQHMQMVLQLAGALNNTMLPPTEQYNQLIKDTAALFGGSTDAAAGYLKQLGLIPQNFQFGVTAMAQVDLSSLVPLESQLHMSLNNLNGKAAGGPGSGMAVVGEQGVEVVQHPDGSSRMVGLHGPEIVNLGVGSSVIPAGNLPHFAAGGSVGDLSTLLGNNLGFGVSGIGYQDSVNALTVMGMAAPAGLPKYTPQPTIDLTGLTGAGNVGGSRGANEAIMQNVFATMFGWAGQEWNAAYQLEMMEAGFNNLAQNPTSTAFGLGQFLDGTWASYGIPKTADPTLQSIAMGRYIQARYHDPIGALAHEHAFHWYGAGGPTSYGMVGINDGGPEAIQLPNGSTVMPAANTAGMSHGGELAIRLEVAFTGNTDSAMATAFMKMIRSNQIQLSANGQRVKVG